jgi:hypothetical protein
VRYEISKALLTPNPILEFTFGAYTDNGFKFTGSLDDIRIYSGVLSRLQINEIYNSGSGLETDLLGIITTTGGSITRTVNWALASTPSTSSGTNLKNCTLRNCVIR